MPKFTEQDTSKYSLWITKGKKPCCMCKEKTKFLDYISEGYLCSTECMDKLNKLVAEREKINLEERD